MIELQGITFAYGDRTVLRDFSCRFEAGRFHGVFGPNGCGKSTMLKIITHELQPLSGRVTPRFSNAVERARTIALVEQDLPVRIPLTVRETVALGRYPWGMARRSGDHVEAALEQLSLTGLAARQYSTLSGGERQKVMLARALAQAAPVILLDEPASALDPGFREHFYRLLQACAAAGKCVIMVTHDLFLTPAYLDRAMLLSGGGIRYDGAPEDVLTGARCREVFGLRSIPGIN